MQNVLQQEEKRKTQKQKILQVRPSKHCIENLFDFDESSSFLLPDSNYGKTLYSYSANVLYKGLCQPSWGKYCCLISFSLPGVRQCLYCCLLRSTNHFTSLAASSIRLYSRTKATLCDG